MGSALDKTVCNNQLIKYLSGPSKAQIYCAMVRNKDRKRERCSGVSWGRGRTATPATCM